MRGRKMIRLTGNLHADFDRVFEEYTKLRDRILGYQERVKSLQASLKASENQSRSRKMIMRQGLLKKMQ